MSADPVKAPTTEVPSNPWDNIEAYANDSIPDNSLNPRGLDRLFAFFRRRAIRTVHDWLVYSQTYHDWLFSITENCPFSALFS